MAKLTLWLRKYQRALTLLVVAAALALGGRWFYLKQVAYLNSYTDADFEADHTWACYELGVAIRYPKSGIFGKARYWVIVVRDRQGRTLKTIYEGPGGYPDVPVRPTFVAVEGENAIYETEDLGKHALHEPMLSRNDCAGRAKAN